MVQMKTLEEAACSAAAKLHAAIPVAQLYQLFRRPKTEAVEAD